jgi:apolipoprotein N-acyltransferase
MQALKNIHLLHAFSPHYGLSLLAGGLSSLALPPLHGVPILFLTLPLLLRSLQQAKNGKDAFWHGWMFGFGFFLAGLYWISFALLTAGDQYLWLLPFAAAGLPAILAIYYGLASLIFFYGKRSPLADILFLTLLLFAADYARSHLLSGFPWNLWGYVWTFSLPILQTSFWLGIDGLSLLSLWLFLAPALCFTTHSKRIRYGIPFVTGLCWLGLYGFGAYSLAQNPTRYETGPMIRLVQPMIAQNEKWDMAVREAHLQKLIELSTLPAPKPITHILWPETAVPYFLTEDTSIRQLLKAIVPTDGALITGGVRRDVTSDGGQRYYNSLLALDAEGKSVATFDKFHLVPFGEYLPFRNWLSIPAIAANFGEDFTAGPGPMTINVPGLPGFAPLICYESIFSGRVIGPPAYPSFIINVTNDGWYGKTAGPHQHMAQSLTRAVEEGLPLLRANNSGISAVIDPMGRTLQQLDLHVTGILDTALPVPRSDALTPSERELHLLKLISFFLFLYAFVALRKI